MRHTRTRRRYFFILTALLLTSCVLFAEDRIESFAPRLKSFIEAKCEEAFGNRVSISIGNLQGGILHPLTLTGCKIKDKKGASIFPPIEITSIKLNCRVWDIFFKGKTNQSASRLLASDSPIDIRFETITGEISGFARLEGEFSNCSIKGFVNVRSNGRVDFTAKFYGTSFSIELKLPNGLLIIDGSLPDDNGLKVNIKTNHFKLGGFDLVCDAMLTGEIAHLANDDPARAAFNGRLETKTLILNYKPFADLKLFYKIANGLLEISELRFSNGLSAHGNILLKRPNNVDCVAMLDNVNLSQLLSSLGVTDPSSIISGTANGKFEVRGPINKSKLNAKIQIRKGTMGTLDFDYLSANLKGDGPIIRIEDSRITRPSGYFILAGEMDLRKLGHNAFFESLEITTDDTAIVWDELDTTKTKGVREVSMKKKVSDELNLNFKRFLSDGIVDESLKDKDAVEIEYKLHPNESLKMMVGQDRDFLGLEHKDKF